MMNKTIDLLSEKFEKQIVDTWELWAGLERLRSKYERLKSAKTEKLIVQFNKVCMDMKAIVSKIEALWRPHRRTLGICKKCSGTRMLVAVGKKRGVGCLNGECYHVEFVKKVS